MYVSRKSLGETAQFRQWIIDAGLQYGQPVLDNISLAFQGGAAYSVVSEELNEAEGSSISHRGSGILGLFAGVGIERPFDRSTCSVFAEIQYNTSPSDVASPLSEYGGLNITLGIRYRFLNDPGFKEDAVPPASIWQE